MPGDPLLCLHIRFFFADYKNFVKIPIASAIRESAKETLC